MHRAGVVVGAQRRTNGGCSVVSIPMSVRIGWDSPCTKIWRFECSCITTGLSGGSPIASALAAPRRRSRSQGASVVSSPGSGPLGRCVSSGRIRRKTPTPTTAAIPRIHASRRVRSARASLRRTASRSCRASSFRSARALEDGDREVVFARGRRGRSAPRRRCGPTRVARPSSCRSPNAPGRSGVGSLASLLLGHVVLCRRRGRAQNPAPASGAFPRYCRWPNGGAA